ncbi:malonyl-ACP O-methyltransferase BioC [Alkalimarinus alittae]|uniref:Malonyl-[acyl-carrier protein] O-methyltransferase n=1 Tax=Alkalimarinus alittae TaxID=2961619 RepID=A0ABY6N7N2_9ALTE|nr:malonyl-ACP O-methyltransferase BioC [Alkalimarinus alittae]UZE97999.1 malonyl-ACP O-methyltransferase BioC [Alkalimarinus alittae]
MEKRQVAESFGRAAGSYDKVAYFQRNVGYRLLELIPQETLLTNNTTRVDLGCGTGYFTPKLQRSDSHIVGLDLSEGMINHARENRVGDIQWIVGDAEVLPFADSSIDLIFSSLAVQWCSSYEQLFAELFRVLKPGGVIAFSTLLDGTLKELEASWQEVDSYRHVNAFSVCSEVDHASGVAGFKRLAKEQYTDVLSFDSVKTLTRELKMLGAHNVNEGRSLKVTGRERILRFKQAYEKYRSDDGRLPASYEVLLSVLTKPKLRSE